MKKNLLRKWLGFGVVIVLISICMVLLFAEPAECESWQQWLLTFAAMKAAAIVCGVVGVGLVEKLSGNGCVDNATDGTEEE